MCTISPIWIKSKVGDCSPLSHHRARKAVKSPILSLTVYTTVMGNTTTRALLQIHTFFRFVVAVCTVTSVLQVVVTVNVSFFKNFPKKGCPCFSLVDLLLGDRFDDSKSLQLSLGDTLIVSCSFRTALMTSLARLLGKLACSAAFFSLKRLSRFAERLNGVFFFLDFFSAGFTGNDPGRPFHE